MSVSFQGYTIGPERMSLDQDKVTAVVDWPTSKTVKELQGFLGFVHFFSFSNSLSHMLFQGEGHNQERGWGGVVVGGSVINSNTQQILQPTNMGNMDYTSHNTTA